MRAQRSQVWELEVRAEDLKDVCSHFVRISLARGHVKVGAALTSTARTVWQTDLELDTPLDDDELAWPGHQPTPRELSTRSPSHRADTLVTGTYFPNSV